MERTLAEAARRLKPSRRLPRLIAITDRHVRTDWAALVQRLPKGSALILRDYDFAERAALGRTLRALTRPRRIRLLVAGDADLARALKADGLHLPEFQLRKRRRFPKSWLITAAVHHRRGLSLAKCAGAELAILAPVFPTFSHPGARPLGLLRFRALAASSPLPVAALGGLNGRNARSLKAAAALAAIRGI